ncbi:hypothetical protein Glove_187g70 [Diversispora epigaea]|uniref:DNA ligase n=1 Tax=Diversispora epigaea TaxID=1348612 RepID=A0A397IRN7_9GLOM|nr:hypothetical protein Glove_187g70 [Diversispora epigaea]
MYIYFKDKNSYYLLYLLFMTSENTENTQFVLSSQQIPLTNSPKPLFSELCRFLEIVTKEKGDVKKHKLESFFKNWRRRYGNDVYPIMRLILPHLDKERTNYGMKESVLAKTYINVLGLSKDSVNSERLIHWKMPGSHKYKTAGDFATVAFEVIAPRSTVTGHGKMSLEDLNNRLDILNAASGQQEYKNVIRHFFTNYTPIEQKWIIRIILKALSIGLSEKTIFQVFHQDASDLFNVCSDLRKICSDLKDPHTRLKLTEIELFHPFKPMLAKPVAIQNIIKLMNGEKFWIEEKLDGERMQLHMKNGRFEYYSRKATQYTYMYGANKDEGSLTRYLSDVFHPRINEIILDGEMVAYDESLDTYLNFGHLKTVALDQSVSNHRSAYPLFVVFDVVYINGKTILDQPLEKRHSWLKSLITDKPGHIKVLEHKYGNETSDLTSALDDAVLLRQEGIIIKKPTSRYVLNERVDEWIKVKPDYLDTLGDNLDLLVIGADYGKGKRANTFGSFMCALRDNNSPDNKPRFLSFCRFGTGFSMKEGQDISNLIKDWTNFDQNKVPEWIVLGRDKPHVIIHPEKSVVVQVKAAEITPTIMFAAGYTLRFPRYERIREDKDWKSSTTFEEMMNLRLQSSSQSQSKKVTEDNMVTTSRLNKRKIKINRRRAGLLETYVSRDLVVESKSEIFKGMDFHVIITKFKGNSKADFEHIIKEHGGKYFQHPDASPNIRIIADSINIRVNNSIKTGKHDVVHPQWILDCVEKIQSIPLQPKYMLFTSEPTKQEFSVRMDEFGDSFTTPIEDIDSLKEIFDRIPIDNNINNNKGEDKKRRRELNDEIELRYFENEGLPLGLFRHCVIYLDYPSQRSKKRRENDDEIIESGENCENIEIDENGNNAVESEEVIDELWALREGCRDNLRLIEYILRFHGAQIIDDYHHSNKISHVIFEDNDLSRINEIKEYFHGNYRLSRQPKFVRSTWVINSENIGALLEEEHFDPSHLINN